MKTLTKFMRNMGIIVIVLLAVTIFNPLVVTKSNEYSLIIQFGKVVRVENSAGPSLRVPFLQSVQKIPKYKMISDLYPSDVTTKDKKVMTVDSFVIWDINDPVKYLASLNASKEKAEVRLGNVYITPSKTYFPPPTRRISYQAVTGTWLRPSRRTSVMPWIPTAFTSTRWRQRSWTFPTPTRNPCTRE